MHVATRLGAGIAAALLILAVAPAPASAAPAGFSVNAASAARVDGYWTPARVLAARPAPRPALAVSAAEPLGEPRLIPAAAAATSVWNTIGRLFFTNPGVGDFVCSANVVTANNRDVIATARHCVMDIGNGRTYTNFRFAPGYSRGSAPYGWWTWRSMGWRVDDRGAGGDNAFIVLNQGGNAGRHVQDVVGASAIAFNQPTSNYARGIGIPADKDYAFSCEGQPYDGPSGGVQIPSCIGLSGGASGGAFVVNYAADGSATQTASFFGSWGESYFAYYRDAAYQVYNGAQNA